MGDFIPEGNSGEDITESIADKVSENMMRRNALLEQGVRSSAAQIIMNCARLVDATEHIPEANMLAVNVANMVALMTHSLGMIPRDVMDTAFKLARGGASAERVIGEIREAVDDRTRDKLRRLMAGEDVPPPEEDGIFIGFHDEEE